MFRVYVQPSEYIHSGALTWQDEKMSSGGGAVVKSYMDALQDLQVMTCEQMKAGLRANGIGGYSGKLKAELTRYYAYHMLGV